MRQGVWIIEGRRETIQKIGKLNGKQVSKETTSDRERSETRNRGA